MAALPTPGRLRSLDELRFDNRFTRLLPGDPEPRNFRRQVQQSCYSRVTPTPVAAPKLIAYTREVCELLELDIAAIGNQAMADVFGGNRVLPDME